MKLTIGIKALNEELHIAASLGSAINAARRFDGEVILADSGSTDRTIEIAKQFPVRIVQLANQSERCCGAGAQLAYQFARGEYFYLMDGDMVLNHEFIEAAMEHLENHPELAAVGGGVKEMNLASPEFQVRAAAAAKEMHRKPGIVDRLDGGGLYRVQAIKSVGYFADRNLHTYEEFELGARLQNNGWKLARIGMVAVYHYGHQTSGYRLIWRRIKSGYTTGLGELLRCTFGHSHFTTILRNLENLRYGAAVIAWWLAILVCFALPLMITIRILVGAFLLLLPMGMLVIRRGGLSLGFYSFVAWNVAALGMIVGVFHSRVRPDQPIMANILCSSEHDVTRDHGG